MVARHVQHAALLVHAHDAEVAVVGGVDAGLVGLVGGFLEVFGELLLDLEEGGLLVDEVLEEGGSRGGRGGGFSIWRRCSSLSCRRITE